MSRILTSEAVDQLFGECFQQDREIKARGVIASSFFSAQRVEANKAAIAALLLCLPNQFLKSGGGGWSFLNMCNDQDGRQWTGLHQTMEKLVLLGMAAGLVGEVGIPRDFLPGGMPYYVVDDKAARALQAVAR